MASLLNCSRNLASTLGSKPGNCCQYVGSGLGVFGSCWEEVDEICDREEDGRDEASVCVIMFSWVSRTAGFGASDVGVSGSRPIVWLANTRNKEQSIRKLHTNATVLLIDRHDTPVPQAADDRMCRARDGDVLYCVQD
jgi:hypothetical protein